MAVPKETLDIIWQIYYYVAVFATIIFVIKLIIFTVVGGDTEVNADFNTETDTDTSFGFISLQTILAFFMGFGWMGYAMLKQLGQGQIVSLLSAIGVGLIFMFGTAFLMFSVKKLEKNVKKDKSTAIGKIGKAYTNFEPKSNGQIEIAINEQLTVADAINATDEFINSFDNVKVIKVENDILYVEKSDK